MIKRGTGKSPFDLRPQRIEPQLQPVLRQRDFLEFDLHRLFGIVSEMAKEVG
jgi:hypothetical protein